MSSSFLYQKSGNRAKGLNTCDTIVWDVKTVGCKDMQNLSDGHLKCESCDDQAYITVYWNDEEHYLCFECLQAFKGFCSECASLVFRYEDHENSDGELICEECFDDHYFTCEHCEEVHHINDRYSDDNMDLCEDCYLNVFITCHACNQFEHADDAHEHDDNWYCDSCFHDNFTQCEGCHEYFSNDDINYRSDRDCYYCNDCYPNGCDDRIRDYGRTPYIRCKPKYAPNELFLGMELEIDCDEEQSHRDLLDRLEGLDMPIWFMHDGSLDNGFEITSQPCTLDYHHDNMAWEELAKACREEGYRSHDVDTCGLHIHASREFFGESHEDVMHEEIAKLLMFFDSNWNNIVKFSRRKQTALNVYARRYIFGDVHTDRNIKIDKAKKSGGMGRYFAVNTENTETIEFRVFKGTLKPTTIYACLEFVDALCRFVKTVDIDEPARLTWEHFCNYIKCEPIRYKNLIAYMQSRHLYSASACLDSICAMASHESISLMAGVI